MSKDSRKLINQFMQIEGLLHRYMMTGRRGVFMNPHRGQGRVLSLLRLKPYISQKELTYLLDMSKQAIGELLSKLENCGYITRTPSSEDGRIMMITLTEGGKTVAEELANDDRDDEDIFKSLSEEEQQHLIDYLERVIMELRKRAERERNIRDRRNIYRR